MEESSIVVTIWAPNQMFAVLQVMNHPVCNSRWTHKVAQNFTLKCHITVCLESIVFPLNAHLLEWWEVFISVKLVWPSFRIFRLTQESQRHK